MDVNTAYLNFKNFKKGIISEDISESIEFLIYTLEEWFESAEYTRDVRELVDILEKDYLFNGKLYRGITLLNEAIDNLEDNIECRNIQSFSLEYGTALGFATNGKVTVDGDENLDMDDEDITPIMMIFNGEGVDISKFSEELMTVLDFKINNKSIIEDEEDISNLKEILEYGEREKEVLVFDSHFEKGKLELTIVKEDI